MRSLSLSVAVVIASAVAVPALAQSNDFSGPVTTGARAPGTWYVDRHAPAGFQTSGGQLVESISGSDYQGANSFYNTQGYSYDLNAGTNNLSIDLTVDQSWLDSGLQQRWAGMWGVGSDGTDVSAYPIIEFITTGTGGEFRAWDSNTGDWTALEDGVGAGTYTLSVGLSGGQFNYNVDGQSWSYDANGSTNIGSVILQGYNSGNSYDIHWDNLNATSGAVPEPASWALMLGGFGLVGGAMRSRKRSVSFA